MWFGCVPCRAVCVHSGRTYIVRVGPGFVIHADLCVLVLFSMRTCGLWSTCIENTPPAPATCNLTGGTVAFSVTSSISVLSISSSWAHGVTCRPRPEPPLPAGHAERQYRQGGRRRAWLRQVHPRARLALAARQASACRPAALSPSRTRLRAGSLSCAQPPPPSALSLTCAPSRPGHSTRPRTPRA